MRRPVATTLAVLAPFAASTIALAQSCMPAITSVGTVTPHLGAANDITTSMLTTLPVRLTYGNGVSVNATVAVVSATQAVASHTISGSTTSVTFDLVSASQTTIRINRNFSLAAPSLKSVQIGSTATRIAFDNITAVTGTPGSGLGRAFTPVTLLGNAWTAAPSLTNRVSIGGATPLTDLHKTLRIDFTAPMTNGTFTFLTDADSLL